MTIKRDIRPSSFHCAECGQKLVEVRRNKTDLAHNLRCLRCDREFMKEEEANEAEMDSKDN